MNTSIGPSASIWQNPEFRSYMAATGFTQFAFSMQQLLTNWMFIDTLNTSAERVGLAQAMIGLPGLVLMLWGGANADRVDGRGLLIRLYVVMALPSVVLAVLYQLGYIHFWVITLWALAIAVGNSLASPALQAMLNRICGTQVQQGVTTSTAIGFLVQICGLILAGQIQTLHAPTVLLVQAAFVLIGSYMITRLAILPTASGVGPTTPHVGQRPSASARALATLANIKEGLVVVARDDIILHVMLLNFASMLFNAGAFAIVFPFIILKTYHGDAHFLAVMMVVFFSGATVSNFALLRFLPILRMGRLFLIMQLTRIVILLALWSQPNAWVLALFTFIWGINMGITSTTCRAIVQERAEPAYRGRVLSVLNIGFLGAQPFAAVILGSVIAAVGPMNALLPGVAVSAVIFAYGTLRTRVWRYESASAL